MVDLQKAKILKLTLSKKPFDVMVTGEKDIEIRRPSNWLKSRLYSKDGSEKSYDYVQFTNGYGTDKPMFIAEYLYFFEVDKESEEILNYSNGLVVEMSEGSIVIVLGSIIQSANLSVTNK